MWRPLLRTPPDSDFRGGGFVTPLILTLLPELGAVSAAVRGSLKGAVAQNDEPDSPSAFSIPHCSLRQPGVPWRTHSIAVVGLCSRLSLSGPSCSSRMSFRPSEI